MSKSIRVRTTPGSGNHYLKVNLEQDFDFLEILSLKLSQEDVYRQFYSDYGVVVGRVIVNNGVGIPNAKVSVFIPVDSNERDEIKDLYPYRTITSKNLEDIRYNLLTNTRQNDCHVPIGSFPTKREILDNDLQLEVFQKYYKYTTTTNQAGDFMIFGIPVGNHTMNVDVDLSDIGIFSQKPYDLMEQGNPKNLFKSTTQFKGGKNLNNLTQVKNQQVGVNIMPFWGENNQNEIGISRIDVDLNYEIKPKAIFIGSGFSDTDKNSINKNCQARKKTGKICESVPVDGILNMIRKKLDGNIEEFSVNGGDVVDEDGVWAYQIPMNLDYMVTDEFGQLIPSEDPNKGIPTRTQVRFKFEPLITGGEGRLRTRANYLIPHNPSKPSEIDYEFGEKTKDFSFRDLYWNKIYTIKNFIPRFQAGDRIQSRKFSALKDVDDCVGTKNPPPFNRMDKDFNPLYTIICMIVHIIVFMVRLINEIISFQIRAAGVRIGRPFCGLGLDCINIYCDNIKFTPGCGSRGACTRNRGETSFTKAMDCFQITLAEALNVYELDFYNDWLNGSLYSVLVKYKHKRHGDKFCDVDKNNENFIVNTQVNDNFPGGGATALREGVIKSYKEELYYAPMSKNGNLRLFATDIVNLGTINKIDWQGQPSIHNLMVPSSYKIPPFTVDDDTETPLMDYGNNKEGLFFELDCLGIEVNPTQSKNIKRLCEIGVGLDEDRTDEPNGVRHDAIIDDNDIENQYVRDAFILLNNTEIDEIPNTGLSSGFMGDNYLEFRGFENGDSVQPRNSFFFYFGTEHNKTAIEKMNKRFFEPCKININRTDGEE